MQTHYVFVDYENTQPGNIGMISERQPNIKIKIFLGRHQNMIPLSLARAMHVLGENAEYIQLDSSRRNAIDFNIAFQLGELAIQHPDCNFSILSNDPGFDAIVESLKSKGINCARYPDIETLLERTSEPSPPGPGKSGQDKVVSMEKKTSHVQAVR
jgi:hypothetical protein